MAHDVKKRFKRQINTFGHNLQKIRLSKNLSQEALADIAGIAYTSINKIENGEINTTIGTVFALAKALEVSPKELFEF